MYDDMNTFDDVRQFRESGRRKQEYGPQIPGQWTRRACCSTVVIRVVMDCFLFPMNVGWGIKIRDTHVQNTISLMFPEIPDE